LRKSARARKTRLPVTKGNVRMGDLPEEEYRLKEIKLGEISALPADVSNRTQYFERLAASKRKSLHGKKPTRQ